MDKEMFNFYKNALTENLCQDYKGLWQAANSSKERLVCLSLQQQAIPYFADFCYRGKGLSKDYILQEFGDYINGKYIAQDCDDVDGYTYELYVDYNGILRVSDDVLHLMWCFGTQATIDAHKCPVLYVSNNSVISLSTDGYNSVRVYLFDESKVVLDDIDENSEVLIYRYSDKCSVELGRFCLGKVNQHNKKLRL